MDKEKIIEAILAKLQEEFDTHSATSKRTRAAGNDSETKAEGKYDTRSTEENYLADGLAKQALAAAQSAKAFQDLHIQDFRAGQPIDAGALVELQLKNDHAWFFLGPAAGGIEIVHAGEIVTVITPGSPLGSQLIGKKAGDSTIKPEAKIRSVF